MIAIDPGLSGGIVRVGDKLSLPPTTQKMPKNDSDLLAALTPHKDWSWHDKKAYLEDLVLYTGRALPGSRVAKYAANWGVVKGMLLALDYKVILVPPKKWQKVLGLGTATGMSKTVWKNKLKDEAARLNPGIKVTLATADALLIYEAAKRGKLE